MNNINYLHTKFYSSENSDEPELNINDPILNELDSFKNLEVGWSFGEGKPINSDVIHKAKKVYIVGKFFIKEANVFPGTDGSILVVFHKKDYSIEVIIHENLSLDITIEKGIGFDFEIIKEYQDVNLKIIENILSNYKEMKWNISGSFIVDTMTEKSKDLEARHFETHPMVVESQSLNTDVLHKRLTVKESRYVTTS